MPEPLAATTPTPSLRRSFVRRGARNLLLCQGVALLLWSVSGSGVYALAPIGVYSTAIGMLCWFFIDGARLLVSAWLQRHAPRPGHSSGWPGPVWMVACIVGGTFLGYSLGSALAGWLTGRYNPSLAQEPAALIVSLLIAVAATYFFYSRERLHLAQAAAEAARRLATENQLRLLQSQLEPHMLFNTLANLRVLIGLDPAKAQAMLDHLIAYLRATLNASRGDAEQLMHPLAAEFDRLADYLALMAIRMGPRLQVQLDLPDALRNCPVPALVLQPLVENAIRHGLEPQLGGGALRVSAEQDGDSLVLRVRDSGVGLAQRSSAKGDGDGDGYGTRHVHARLAATYGDRASFSLHAPPRGQPGTWAELRLPMSAAAMPVSARSPAHTATSAT